MGNDTGRYIGHSDYIGVVYGEWLRRKNSLLLLECIKREGVLSDTNRQRGAHSWSKEETALNRASRWWPFKCTECNIWRWWQFQFTTYIKSWDIRRHHKNKNMICILRELVYDDINEWWWVCDLFCLPSKVYTGQLQGPGQIDVVFCSIISVSQ